MKKKKILFYSLINIILLLSTNSCGKYGSLKIDDKKNNNINEKKIEQLQENDNNKKQTKIDYYDSDFNF